MFTWGHVIPVAYRSEFYHHCMSLIWHSSGHYLSENGLSGKTVRQCGLHIYCIDFLPSTFGAAIVPVVLFNAAQEVLS